MKKRILPILILLVMLLGNILPLTTYAVDTAANIKIVNPQGGEILVAPGDTFSLDVMFENPVKGATLLAGFLTYDTEKLEIQDAKEIQGVYTLVPGQLGDSVNMVMYDANEPEKVSFTYSCLYNDILKAGKCFTIKFKVKEGATGTFDIGFLDVKYASASEDETSYSINKGGKVTGKIKTPLKSISIDKTETIGIGETKTLDVTYNPTNTTDPKGVTWKSNSPEIAKVETDGTITGVAPGEAIITATSKANSQITATCTVTVTSKLTKISLNKSEIEMAKGQEESLVVTYKPSNTTDSKNITWSSSVDSVASVKQDGTGKAIVTAKSNGQTIITATSEVQGVAPVSCTVNVTSKLQEIKLSETDVELNKGSNKTLTVSYVPEDTTDSKKVTWKSSDNSIATVDENGKITAVKPGTVTITATSEVSSVKPVTATVVVVSHLTGIKIKGGNISELAPKQTKDLEIDYEPSDTTDSRTIVWSSDKQDIVSVDSTGKITALKPGTANITAKCGEFQDTISVTVPEVHMTSIAFQKPEITISKNEIVPTTILYYPDNTTDIRDVTYESQNPDIATVESDGKIKGISAGKATIIAKSNVQGVADAKCIVNVIIPLTGIKLDKSNVQLEKGTSDQLTVIYNEDDTTDDKTITWTSLNPSVAEVDSTGKVTAKGAGTAVIKAQVGNHVATCEVTVKVPLTGIKIKDTLNLLKNASETLTVEYLPSDTTDDRKVIWESEDETVATVDSTGKITAKKAGTTNIVAKVGSFTAKCLVTVEEINLEGIKISNKIDSLLKGQEWQLEVIYLPENTTDDKIVTWSSSDESVVTVDENGVIKGLKEGKATITIQNGDMTDSFEIEVKEVKLTGMEVTNKDTTLRSGESLQLSVDFLPGNTTDSRELVYSSSDENIATVDENGVVRAIRPGKAVITVTAANGVQTQIEIVVEENMISENEIARSNALVASQSPKTGDMNVVLYISLMIISLLGIIITKKTKK